MPQLSFHFNFFQKYMHTYLNLTTMKNKNELWKYVIQMAVAFLTAVGTSLGVTSCMSMI